MFIVCSGFASQKCPHLTPVVITVMNTLITVKNLNIPCGMFSAAVSIFLSDYTGHLDVSPLVSLFGASTLGIQSLSDPIET